MTEKQKLRKQQKTRRDGLSVGERAGKSALICDALKKHPLCAAARSVYCYAPLGSEADIWPFADWLWKSGRRVAFPRVIGDGKMEFFEVRGREELCEGSFHVMEPVCDGREMVDWEGALVIVPLVAFAKDGTRCGYGKGYYDRYFAAHPNLVRFGVGFSCQRCEELRAMCDRTDERLDYVQTEDACYEALQSFSYRQMEDKICGSRRFGRAPGAACSAALMELLGHPEREMSFVHIAGTNGKGSVAAFLRQICAQEGVRVGLFTSPHLQSFTERIQVSHGRTRDGEAGREDVLRLGRKVLALDHVLMVSRGMKCTMFDLCFAIALLYYKEQGVTLAILETGMGGRLDSTNCIPAPLVTVITAIGLEHTEYLGDTLQKIAAEKAGILKRGTRAVIMGQEREAQEVLTARCEEFEIPYCISGEADAQGDYNGVHYEIGMPGAYQRKNAAAAIEAAELLCEIGEADAGLRAQLAAFTPEGIMAGVAQARWPGRMEVVREMPWVLLDGAHNAPGVAALAQSLRELDGNVRFIFFMGVMAGKDYMQMAEQILPLAKHIYTLAPESVRALSAEVLCTRLRAQGAAADVCGSVDEAVRLIDTFSEEERCVVFGSLYLIGEMRGKLSDSGRIEDKRKGIYLRK